MNSRAKGIRFERHVAKQLSELGEVRGLEAGGDHFLIQADGAAWHVEAKDQKVLRLPLWLRQQAKDAPAGARRVLVFKVPLLGVFACEPLTQWVERATR